MTKKSKLVFAARLANNQTWPERILWARLKRKQLGYSFQRQAIVCGFVADFWCPATRVAIELDGPIHERGDVAANDGDKNRIMARAGVDLLRFPNWHVYKRLGQTLIVIWDHCYARFPQPLKPFVWANSNSRYEQGSEFLILREHQERRRLQAHQIAFDGRYKEIHSQAVEKSPKRKGASWWKSRNPQAS